MAIFVTGATGFLGRRLVAALATSGARQHLLVRAKDVESGRRRVEEALATIGAQLPGDGRVTICPGALDAPGLGLGPADRSRIVAACDDFLHCGASVRFDLSIAAARAVNVGGTAAVLELVLERMRCGSVARFDHVSTAFVAGARVDVVYEHEFDDRAVHRNTYERTKFEAEQMLRHAPGLPITIFRPSIVIPDRDSLLSVNSGHSPIHWPSRLYATGMWRVCPGRESTPLDLVPVTFVRDAILALRSLPPSGATYHLTAGLSGAMTLGDAAALLRATVEARKPLRFVDPDRWMRYVHPVLAAIPLPSLRRVVRHGQHYVPYFAANPRFDNRVARAALATKGIAVPASRDALARLFGLEDEPKRRRSS